MLVPMIDLSVLNREIQDELYQAVRGVMDRGDFIST